MGWEKTISNCFKTIINAKIAFRNGKHIDSWGNNITKTCKIKYIGAKLSRIGANHDWLC